MTENECPWEPPFAGTEVEHLAAEEDYTFTARLAGQPIGQPWEEMGWAGGSGPTGRPPTTPPEDPPPGWRP